MFLFCFATGKGKLIIGKGVCLCLYLVSFNPPFCQSSQIHVVRHRILFPNSLGNVSVPKRALAFAFPLFLQFFH